MDKTHPHFLDLIVQLFRVCEFAYEDNQEWFLKKFAEDITIVYDKCPTPLCKNSLYLFLEENIDSKDTSSELQIIENWKLLLKKHRPEVYKHFDHVYAELTKEDSKAEERQRTKARERQESARKCTKYWEYKFLSNGEWGSIRKSGPSQTDKPMSGFV